VGRRLLALNALLAVASLACAAFVVREVTAPWAPAPVRSAPAAPPAPAPPEAAPRPDAGAYTVVATRNLFSSTRSETTIAAASGLGTAPVVKPSLHGVVLRDQNPIAYLEDPTTKRVTGYRVGDAVAGGTLQTIASDHVIIARPEGPVDVRLHDPSRPRPEPPAPGQPGVVPGVLPRAGVPGVAPGTLPRPGMLPQVNRAPGTLGPFVLPGGRLSPSPGRGLPLPGVPQPQAQPQLQPQGVAPR
jgi:hypothetical protein